MGSREQLGTRAEVLVAPSWACNLRCSYCFVADNTSVRGGPRLTPDAAARVIDALDAGLPEVDRICVHLYGGEPLLHLEVIGALVDRALEVDGGRFTFAITTNGTVASGEAIALLQKGRFDVVLSIDGPPDVHDTSRRTAGGAPTHALVMRFLQRLRTETDCRVRASAVVRPGWTLGAADAYLRTLPVDAIKAQAVRVPPDSPYALTADQRQAYRDDLDVAGERVMEDLERGQIPLDDRFSGRVLQLLAGRTRDRFCGAGATVFGVTPDGAIRPCLLVDGAPLGRIDDDPAAWRAAGRAWREAHGPREECERCDARHLCGGGCPAMLAVCGADECDLVRHTCRIAERIYARFADRPEALVALAGVT